MKLLTLRRTIILLCTVFVYSFAFLFVKIYAERSVLESGEPSNSALFDDELKTDDSNSDESHDTQQLAEGEIIKKADVNMYAMLAALGTTVEDPIVTLPSQTSEEPEVTSSPETKPEVVTTLPTEKPEKPKETKSESTCSPEPTTAVPTTTTKPETSKKDEEDEVINEDKPLDEENDETVNDELDEQVVDDEIVSYEKHDEEILDDLPDEDAYLEDPEASGGFKSMTQEEYEEFLKELGIDINGTYISNTSIPESNPNDVLYSTNSYHNQILTIYDTKQKKIRTENAFDLVCEITNYEVGDTMNPEAIKAQAVAIYTYCKYYEAKGEYAEIGTKSDVPDLVKECVQAVDGLAIYYDGNYIMSAFSASTGGYSAASKNVWGGDLPYLQSVKNDFDQLDDKNYGIATTYTVNEVREKIEKKTDIKLSDNYSDWIRVLTYNDSIYVGDMSIDGHTTAYINGRERTITGHVFRTYVLNIRSTAFNVTYADGVFTFITYGYGHGVGMSQVGADLYAEYGGYTFDQILHHYYTGVTIK